MRTVPVRFRILAILFLGSAVNFIDRVNISIAAPVMMKEAGWDKSQFGIVFSAFMLGYCLMQIPGGVLSDRTSPKKVIAFAFLGFSFFTLLTPLGIYSIFLLLFIRFAVGAAESVTFPAVTSFNVKWFPRSEFGRAQTISAAGGSFGQLVAYPLTAVVVLFSSWEIVFILSAVLGFIWVSVWVRYSADYPRRHSKVSPGELQKIECDYTQSVLAAKPLSISIFSPTVIMLAGSGMAFSCILWSFLFWIPTYLMEERGFSLAVVGAIGVGIQGCGLVGTIGGGALSDLLVRRGFCIRIARTAFAAACITVAMILLIFAAHVVSRNLCAGLLMTSYLTFTAAMVAFFAAPAAIDPERAGSIFGVINFSASLGGVLGPVAVGFAASRVGGWTDTFEAAAALGILSSILLVLAPIRDRVRVSTPVIG